jgi:hypothetical protein
MAQRKPRRPGRGWRAGPRADSVARRLRIRRIRRQVMHGDYENPLKLSIAMDRLLDDLARVQSCKIC